MNSIPNSFHFALDKFCFSKLNQLPDLKMIRVKIDYFQVSIPFLGIAVSALQLVHQSFENGEIEIITNVSGSNIFLNFLITLFSQPSSLLINSSNTYICKSISKVFGNDSFICCAKRAKFDSFVHFELSNTSLFDTYRNEINLNNFKLIFNSQIFPANREFCSLFS
jgi:hypothetical protein